MKVLVCGGRSFNNGEAVERYLDMLHAIHNFTQLIHGDNKGHKGRPGADRLAGSWANSRHIDVRPFPADWDQFGRAAGPMRNGEMLAIGRPDLLVAFPGGRGTRNMKMQADAAGVRIIDLSIETVRTLVTAQWKTISRSTAPPTTTSATASATFDPSAI